MYAGKIKQVGLQFSKKGTNTHFIYANQLKTSMFYLEQD